ncbi:MAG: hypothetical protein JNK76_08920 [Planctomycetales bacterium]|nr:hypothetical protein [Planctomycetales bacterium]
MSHESHSRPPLYTHLEVSAALPTQHPTAEVVEEVTSAEVLRDIRDTLDKQNVLLEELVGLLAHNQRQRNQELAQWKAANPTLVRSCRRAAETLSRVQTEFLRQMTREVNENSEALADGEFVLNEFVDRFGPRMAHLNGVLQVLSTLSNANPTSGT